MDTSKTEANLTNAVTELQAIIIEHERAIHFAKSEINRIIDAAPDTFRKKYRVCGICQEWTLERWSAHAHTGCTCCKPQCAKHTKSRDSAAMAILREAFYGA